MGEYLVQFRAVVVEPLEPDAAERLEAALGVTPGLGQVDATTQDPTERSVSGGFLIEVRGAMADAARDGSRLAKQALNGAGMPDAMLVELSVKLPGGRPPDA